MAYSSKLFPNQKKNHFGFGKCCTQKKIIMAFSSNLFGFVEVWLKNNGQLEIMYFKLQY